MNLQRITTLLILTELNAAMMSPNVDALQRTAILSAAWPLLSSTLSSTTVPRTLIPGMPKALRTISYTATHLHMNRDSRDAPVGVALEEQHADETPTTARQRPRLGGKRLQPV